MKNGTYNINLFFPTELLIAIKLKLNKKYFIHYSKHYQYKCRQLRLPYGVCRTALYGDVTEAEVENGEIKKILTRVKSEQYKDYLCFVVIFTKNKHNKDVAFVKTVWINNYNDNHDTIKKEKYISNNT